MHLNKTTNEISGQKDWLVFIIQRSLPVSICFVKGMWVVGLGERRPEKLFMGVVLGLFFSPCSGRCSVRDVERARLRLMRKRQASIFCPPCSFFTLPVWVILCSLNQDCIFAIAGNKVFLTFFVECRRLLGNKGCLSFCSSSSANRNVF